MRSKGLSVAFRSAVGVSADPTINHTKRKLKTKTCVMLVLGDCWDEVFICCQWIL